MLNITLLNPFERIIFLSVGKSCVVKGYRTSSNLITSLKHPRFNQFITFQCIPLHQDTTTDNDHFSKPQLAKCGDRPHSPKPHSVGHRKTATLSKFVRNNIEDERVFFRPMQRRVILEWICHWARGISDFWSTVPSSRAID